MEEKQINVSINEGDSMFAHETTVTFNPTQFVFDFKSITPRIDMRNKEGHSLALKHSVIIMDPYQAKGMIDLMKKVLDDYEKKFGKIEKPKQLVKMEKKRKEEKQEKTTAPSYFG
jgi:tetrahydromethanopterin S-methyltransferase subunit A